METKEGKITRVKQNEQNHFLTIDKVDYSGYGDCEHGLGDTVKIKYEVNGKYKNIKDIELLKKATPEEKQEASSRYTDEELKAIHKKDSLIISGGIVANLTDINSVTMAVIADKVVELSEKIQKKAWGE
ncbi:MAG: hypothetical protein KAS32_09325 [Candidatus Peribacteraceae bacterium]|nr:hypothetical protein [Candidatus Peribacteraceae bacterium]